MASPRPPYDPHQSRQPIQYQYKPYNNSPYAYNQSQEQVQQPIPSSSSQLSPQYRSQDLERQQLGMRRERSPSFPLLHSTFARHSTATTSEQDAGSYLDMDMYRDSVDSKASSRYQDSLQYHQDYMDDESVYSSDQRGEPSSPALRDSWRSGSTARLASDRDYDDAESPISNYQPQEYAEGPLTPTVVVSAWPDGQLDDPQPEQRPSVGKQPVINSVLSTNFSRPVQASQYEPDNLPFEVHKRMVLERNASRGQGRSPSPYSNFRQAPSPIPRDQSHNQQTPYPSSSSLTPSPPNSSAASYYSSSSISPPTTSASTTTTMSRSVTLSRRPPSIRADSPVELYDRYSYYELGSATPSPTGDGSFPAGSTKTRGIHFADGVRLPVPRSTSRNASPINGGFPSPGVPDMNRLNMYDGGGEDDEAQKYLQLGIKHHEANELKLSASYFEKSATINGGCGVGKLMWGLTLRHGWGCPKNEKSGFNWLRKAAESAMEDLETARKNMSGVDNAKVQNDLVLAIYEVGQCFFHGWGVAKDMKAGVVSRIIRIISVHTLISHFIFTELLSSCRTSGRC
jgi:hypothetical protein